MTDPPSRLASLLLPSQRGTPAEARSLPFPGNARFSVAVVVEASSAGRRRPRGRGVLLLGLSGVRLGVAHSCSVFPSLFSCRVISIPPDPRPRIIWSVISHLLMKPIWQILKFTTLHFFFSSRISVWVLRTFPISLLDYLFIFFAHSRAFSFSFARSWKTADLVQWLHRVVHSRVFLLVNASHFSWPFGRWGLSLLCGDTLHPRGLAPQQAMNSFGPNCKLRPAYDDRSPGLRPAPVHSARVRLDAERGAPSRPPSSGAPSPSSGPADPDPSHAPCSQHRAGVTVRVPTAPVTAPRGPRDVAADT